MRGTIQVALAIAITACSTAARAADERYYALIIDGKRVGYSHYVIETTPDGRKITGDSLIKLSLLGSAGEQTIQTIYLLSPDGRRPLRFTLSARLNTNSPSEIDCRFEGGKLIARSTIPGVPGDKTYPWTANTHFIGTDTDAEAARLIRELGSARSRTVRYYEPATFDV